MGRSHGVREEPEVVWGPKPGGRGSVVVKSVGSGTACIDPPPGLTLCVLCELRQSTGPLGASGTPSAICDSIFTSQGL